MRPLRDGKGLFHEEPDELASVVEAHGLKLIELGRQGRQYGVLPHLEEEAIARLRNVVGPLTASELEWKEQNWDYWREQWVKEAHYFLRNSMQGPDEATTAYSAAEVLARAAEMRWAMQAGNAEKAAALAMLVASWVFIGGVSVRLATSEPVAKKYRKTQRDRAKKERSAVKTDDGGFRKRDLVQDALKQAGEGAGTSDVWPHLWATLDRLHMSPNEVGAKQEREIYARDAKGNEVHFTFKGVQTMLRRIREGEAAKRGRPKKKPR